MAICSPPFSCFQCVYTSYEKECDHTEICRTGEDKCYLARVDGGQDNDNLCFYRMGCMKSSDYITYKHKLESSSTGTIILQGDTYPIDYFECCPGLNCNKHTVLAHPQKCSLMTTVKP